MRYYIYVYKQQKSDNDGFLNFAITAEQRVNVKIVEISEEDHNRPTIAKQNIYNVKGSRAAFCWFFIHLLFKLEIKNRGLNIYYFLHKNWYQLF